MKRISICGVDGTGKTSVIRAIQSRYAGRRAEAIAFRAPQYHEDPAVPCATLSRAIDELGLLGDELKDPLLKTCALFLSMTLYGEVDAFYAGQRPKFLFSERQALADSLAYSKFYRSLLTGPLKRESLEEKLTAKFGVDGMRALEGAVDAVARRAPRSVDTRGLDLWQLPLFIRTLFELPPEKLVKSLMSIYQCELPNQILLLRVDSGPLMERLALKAAGGTIGELHEKKHILELLQGALEKSCAAVAALRPGLDFQVLDTSKWPLEATVEKVMLHALE